MICGDWYSRGRRSGGGNTVARRRDVKQTPDYVGLGNQRRKTWVVFELWCRVSTHSGFQWQAQTKDRIQRRRISKLPKHATTPSSSDQHGIES